MNYNQVVKALNTNFSEKKALASLYKLEKATIELADLNRQIIELTREFETRWLQREAEAVRCAVRFPTTKTRWTKNRERYF